MSEINFLVKLRDAFRMAHEAIDEYIDSCVPKKESKQSTWDLPLPWDPSKVKWERAEGTKGPYEKSSSQMTEDAKKMLAYLKKHGGKLSRDGYFYWVFTDEATIGRKKKN